MSQLHYNKNVLFLYNNLSTSVVTDVYFWLQTNIFLIIWANVCSIKCEKMVKMAITFSQSPRWHIEKFSFVWPSFCKPLKPPNKTTNIHIWVSLTCKCGAFFAMTKEIKYQNCYQLISGVWIIASAVICWEQVGDTG